MSLNTFDKTQTQYERKMARQKQLDMMEAAASGKVSPATSQRSLGSTQTSNSGDGGVGSARRFLWDADEEEYKNVPSRAFTGGAEADQQVNLVGARSNAGILPRFSATTGMESSGKNLAPRRGSAWHNDASPSADAEEYLEDIRFGKAQRGGALSCIGDCCLATFQTLVGVCALIAEHVTGLCRCNKRSLIILGALFALIIFGVSVSAIVKRTKHQDKILPNPDPGVKDPMRFNAIRDNVLESAFTDAVHVDTHGTAQNLAIRWLTDDDPAKMEPDDDTILQRYALATFFFSTYVSTEYKDETEGVNSTMADDFEWNNMEHWMSDKGICMWFGVTCPPRLHEGMEEVVYNSNNDILHLNLTDNNIRGTIPSEIAALENIITLDLGRNRLEGKIPDSITSLEFLTELYLEENALTGTLSAEFGKLQGLRELFVGTNRLMGTIPGELNQLTNLRALGLDENFFTGTIPYIWDLKELLILYLDSNQLTGTLHWELKHLSQLVDLRVRKNFLTGTLPFEMDLLTHLELLYLDDNQFMGSIPEMFAKLPRLEEIQMYKNQFTGTLPESIAALDDLKVLYLDNNNFQGTIHEAFGNLRDVHTMFLFNNQLTGSIPTSIGQMEDLKDVQLYNNKFTGPIPSEIGNCFQLEKLEIQDNSFTGQLPTTMAGLEKLALLKVYRNQFIGSVPPEVCNLKEVFDLTFVAADCNMDNGGTVTCDCCNTCYP